MTALFSLLIASLTCLRMPAAGVPGRKTARVVRAVLSADFVYFEYCASVLVKFRSSAGSFDVFTFFGSLNIWPPFMGMVSSLHPLKALEPGWVTNRQIEAARVALTRPNRFADGAAIGTEQCHTGPVHDVDGVQLPVSSQGFFQLWLDGAVVREVQAQRKISFDGFL